MIISSIVVTNRVVNRSGGKKLSVNGFGSKKRFQVSGFSCQGRTTPEIKSKFKYKYPSSLCIKVDRLPYPANIPLIARAYEVNR